VLDRHFAGGVKSAGKSLFSSGLDLRDLILKAQSVPPVKQATGNNFERIVDAGQIIGIDRVTGLPTSIYTVITNAAGQLVTTFPGRP
jgi:hypothetical protein